MAARTSSRITDDAILKQSIVVLGNVSVYEYDNFYLPILDANGIFGFYRDFTTLSDEDLSRMVETDRTTKISYGTKKTFKSILSFFHFESGKAGRRVQIEKYTQAEFDDFRASYDYDPTDAIVHWKRLARGGGSNGHS